MKVSGYYDPHPLVVLGRHLAIIGLLATETRAVGRRVAALSGLPFYDLDRAIEHQEGRSLRQLVTLSGEAGLRAAERSVLDRILDAEPRGILSLGDGALIDSASREAVATRTTLWALELELHECFWRVRALQAAAEDGRWHPVERAIGRVSELRPYFQLRSPGLSSAQKRVSAYRKGSGAQATAILEQLLAEVEP